MQISGCLPSGFDLLPGYRQRDTRDNVNKIYNFKTGCVKTECLQEGWQTSGSLRIVRAAFNLYCNGTPSVGDYEAEEDQLKRMSVLYRRGSVLLWICPVFLGSY